jgi:hypothetical protein
MLDTFNWEIEKARHCRVVKGGLDSQSSLSPEGSPTLNARAEFHVKNVSRGGQFITPPVAGFEGHTVLEGLAKFNRLRSSIFHTEASCVNAKRPTCDGTSASERLLLWADHAHHSAKPI